MTMGNNGLPVLLVFVASPGEVNNLSSSSKCMQLSDINVLYPEAPPLDNCKVTHNWVSYTS